ncbi:MAG TPA: LLM class flavin-dependent oxidoreductase [Streptosporangiaceae bacterium]|jgi:hypothetical protein
MTFARIRPGTVANFGIEVMQPCGLAFSIPDFTAAGDPQQLGSRLAAVARTADVAGFDSIGVMDHFFQIGIIGPPEREMLEAYTTLGYLAACTNRARLLTLVTGPSIGIQAFSGRSSPRWTCPRP